MKRPFVMAVALLLSACGGGGGAGSGSTASSAVPNVSTSSIVGSYAGTISDHRAGNGSATLTIAQSGASISGTFTDVFSSSGSDNSGSLSGSFSGSSVQIILTPSNPNTCPYSFTGTLNGTTISGTYATFNCSVSDGGSISVTQS